MSLVFSAFTPHSPLLIPAIGKENLKKLEKTKQAMERLEEDLYLSKPDTILLIAPHHYLMPDAFTVDMCPEYETDLRDFGDLSTKLKFKGDIVLATRLCDAAKYSSTPTTMICERFVDHGVAVPLSYLAPHLPNVSVLPVGFSELDGKAHLDFGYLIKDEIMSVNKRVAVIASGDLSHALTAESPAEFNEAGPEFDAKVQEFLANKNVAGMLQWNKIFVAAAAAESGYRTLLILLGILHNVDYQYKLYCYESPLGVGYLTANFVL